MHTTCMLTVSPSMLCSGWGCVLWEGVCSWGYLLPGGVCSCRDVYSGRVFAPRGKTESQMPVKTLPCPNFIAGSNKLESAELLLSRNEDTGVYVKIKEFSTSVSSDSQKIIHSGLNCCYEMKTLVLLVYRERTVSLIFNILE